MTACEKAAAAGQGGAFFFHGTALRFGYGLAQDVPAGVALLKRGAAVGSLDAIDALAYLLAFDVSGAVPQDLGEAYVWVIVAASRRTPESAEGTQLAAQRAEIAELLAAQKTPQEMVELAEEAARRIEKLWPP